MQLLAKFKNILYMGFRATLNFRKLEKLFWATLRGFRDLPEKRLRIGTTDFAL